LLATRNALGQLNKPKKGGFNPDRPLSIVEEVATDFFYTYKLPTGEDHTDQKGNPKRVLGRQWVKLAYQAILVAGGFYARGKKQEKWQWVDADSEAGKAHIATVLKTADKLTNLSVTDMQYIARYKRDGLIENPQITMIKNHLTGCRNICSILDVYAPQFAMRGWQREAINRKDFIIALMGGRGRGGSHVLIPMIVLPLMMSEHPIISVINRKDKASNRVSTFISALALLTVPEFALMVKNVNRSLMKIEFINGSILVFGGFHTKQQEAANKGIGATDDMGGGAYSQALEELTDGVTEDNFLTVDTSTRAKVEGMPPGQIVTAMNPGPPTHWFYTDIMQAEKVETTPQGGKVVKYGNKTAVIYEKTAKDNGWLMENNPDYWEQLLAIKSPTMRDRLAFGKWVSAEGAVYFEFDPDRHVVSDPDFDIMDKLSNRDGGYIAIGGDWGARHPSVILWAYVLPIIEKRFGSGGVERSYKTWDVTIYRQLYLYDCNRTHLAAFIASFPDSKRAKMFIGGHDGVSELNEIKQHGIRATHNKDKKAIGEIAKETMAEEANTAFFEGRLKILDNSLINNDKIPQKLKLSDYKPPQKGKPISLETELPSVVWEKKTIGGRDILTGKILKRDDDASDTLLNVLLYAQNNLFNNNAKNLIKAIKGLGK
jgi:hypothetical protein